MAHGSTTTPEYFKVFGTKQTNDPTLIAPRNQRRLKHMMLGPILWNSLTPKFQLEMLMEEISLKKGDSYNGLLLWCLIVEKVNLTTNISIVNLTDKLKNAKLDDFGQDIKEFNTWFANKRNTIIREVGKGGFTEYKRCLFKIYCAAENKEFMLAIIQERRDWMMGKQKAGYLHSDAMSFALKMYNNQRSLGEWKSKGALTKKKTEKDTKYLALLIQMEAIVNSVGKADPTKSDGREGKGTAREAYSSW
eukprot:12488301-Ditylum_brightwellii.AAC.1